LPSLADRSSLRPDVVEGVDILFVRELSSGIYFGPSGRGADERGPYGFHTMRYHDHEIRRIARQALAMAQMRSRRLTVAHKENALPNIQWQALVGEESHAFPDVEVEGMLVDSLAMELVRQPKRFDVVLAGNMFGDILSDLGGAIAGSIGVLPSASLNEQGFGLFEPVHGTAPNIAGKGIANPLAMIGSIEMMLQHWGFEEAAASLRHAQEWALARNLCTADLARDHRDKVLSTMQMADAIVAGLEEAAVAAVN
jgi:isocitrate/isopropylmalate dehydrogenase